MEIVCFQQNFSLTEPGMKKELSIDTTTAIISDIEKNHRCVIQRETRPEATHAEKTEEATVVADGGTTTGASGPSTMNLPYHSMSFVNDKEVKMASGQRITIVVGDLAHEKVLCGTMVCSCTFYFCDQDLIHAMYNNSCLREECFQFDSTKHRKCPPNSSVSS